MGTRCFQEEARSTATELERCRQERSQENGHQLGRSWRGCGGQRSWRNRVAQCVFDAGWTRNQELRTVHVLASLSLILIFHALNSQAVVTTTVRLPFDCSSTARRQLYWNSEERIPPSSGWCRKIVTIKQTPGNLPYPPMRSIQRCGSVAEWLGRWTCDQQVASSNPGLSAPRQVVNTHVPLSPSSIIW